MPILIDHKLFWPPQTYSADQRLKEDSKIGVRGDPPPYLKPGTFFVYFSRSESGPSGGIYNLTADQAELVVRRLVNDRNAPFERVLEGIPGAGFAYRNENIRYIE